MQRKLELWCKYCYANALLNDMASIQRKSRMFSTTAHISSAPRTDTACLGKTTLAVIFLSFASYVAPESVSSVRGMTTPERKFYERNR